jgi:hypothetical protein
VRHVARARIACSGLLLVLATGVANAQKTDSVWIRNGDRITGEVKSLYRGLLKYDTDDLGTISIEWDKVVQISSPATYEVQLTSGAKYYGSLGVAPGQVIVGGDTIALTDVVIILPIERTVIARLTGYLDLGFSYQKANSTLQLTSGGQVTYRGPTSETRFEFTTFREDREEESPTSRLTSALTERLLFDDRWSAGVAAGFERNEELDLAGRGTVLGFGARTLTRTNHVESWATAGIVVTRERYFSADTAAVGFEGLIGASFSAFRYDRPKLNASVTSQAYPSFSVRGRVRWQNDLRVSYELVADFMLTVTLFDAFDSKPPVADAPKNDFGTTLAITWSF